MYLKARGRKRENIVMIRASHRESESRPFDPQEKMKRGLSSKNTDAEDMNW